MAIDQNFPALTEDSGPEPADQFIVPDAHIEAAPESAWRRYQAALGPGLVTGASDDDPSGIATYAQAGAQFRYASLWTVLLSFPQMAAVQEIYDRTAVTTGQSLGTLARHRFGRRSRAVIGLASSPARR
jgi:Mn2+/Fe2+ NRAMP family transporter